MTRTVPTILIAVILSSCRSHEGTAEFWRNECEKTELAHRLELAEYRLSLPSARHAEELEHMRNLISEMEVRLWNLRSDQSALISDIARMEDRNTELSKMALANQREKSHGRIFDTIAAKNGRTYQNVKVVQVDDSGVSIRHEDGSARLGYADLSTEQRLFFGIEESTALAAEERERQESLLYEQSIEMQMAAIRKNEEIASANLEEKENARALRSRMAKINTPREPSLLSQPPRPFGTGSIYRRSPGYYQSGYYRTAYRYVYAYPSSSNPFCASRAPQTFSTNRITQSPFIQNRPCPLPVPKSSPLPMPITP